MPTYGLAMAAGGRNDRAFIIAQILTIAAAPVATMNGTYSQCGCRATFSIMLLTRQAKKMNHTR